MVIPIHFYFRYYPFITSLTRNSNYKYIQIKKSVKEEIHQNGAVHDGMN
jgi:hypothetical protein